MKLHDELDTYREVATRLNAVPLGEAPIDVIIKKLSREGKLRHVGINQLTILDVRRSILGAWWAARSVAAKQTRKELQDQFAVPAHAYRQQLRLLRVALTKFRCKDQRSCGSPLDIFAALGNSAAAKLTDDLRRDVRATQRSARRVSKVLAEVEREYGARGRPGAPTFTFAKKLARLWHELTGKLPSATHTLDDRWIGPFVAFVEAAVETLNTDELKGTLPVAADKAARQYRREFRHRRQLASPLK